MKKILTGFLLLLLAACAAPAPEPGPTVSSSFSFNIDPVAETVELGSPNGALKTQAEALLPRQEMELAEVTYAFLPGNVLRINAQFRNLTACDITELSFSRVSDLTTIVSSSEPTVTSEKLGGDGALAPNEVTGVLDFVVTHEGQAFTYEVVAAGNLNCEGSDCTNPPNIPDPELREAIRDALQKPFGPITCADLLSLTSLGAAGTSLEGLQFATNLEGLGVRVPDEVSRDFLEPLAGLEKLTGLGFGGRGPEADPTTFLNLEHLSGLNNLEFLSAGDKVVDDISPLAGLPELRELRLTNTSVLEDYSALQNLPNLKVLFLDNLYPDNDDSVFKPEEITTIDFLEGVTGLTALYLEGNSVTDISPLAGLPNLEVLDLTFNKVSDIGPLSGLTKMRELRLASNEFADLSPLSGLEALERLGACDNRVTNLGPLVQNPGLGEGEDLIGLEGNPLDLSAGSQALQDIETLELRNPNRDNVFITYSPSCY